MRETCNDLALAVQLEVVADGEQALDFLRQESRYAHARTPDLVLLELDIPRVQGLDVLAVRRQMELYHIPVVMWSHAATDKDIRQAYLLHANAYVEKPGERELYCARLRAIVEFFALQVPRLAREAE